MSHRTCRHCLSEWLIRKRLFSFPQRLHAVTCSLYPLYSLTFHTLQMYVAPSFWCCCCQATLFCDGWKNLKKPRASDLWHKHRERYWTQTRLFCFSVVKLMAPISSWNLLVNAVHASRQVTVLSTTSTMGISQKISASFRRVCRPFFSSMWELPFQRPNRTPHFHFCSSAADLHCSPHLLKTIRI